MIHLRPMSFSDISLFYPDAAFSRLSLWYACFGGVPAYAERASSYKTPEKALADLVLDVNGVLYQEAGISGERGVAGAWNLFFHIAQSRGRTYQAQ